MPTKPMPPPPGRPAGASQTHELYSSRTGDRLGRADKVYRDAFVSSYCIDFDGATALFRIGYKNPKTAKMRSCMLLREPYVLEQIQKRVQSLKPEDIVTRQQVMAHMWDLANNSDSDKSRVQATAHVAKMLGMMLNKEDNSSTAPQCVMLIPCTTPEEWAQAAPMAQAVLKQNAAKHAA